MRHKLLLISLFMAVVSVGQAAEVFTTTGSNGERVYTDKPQDDAQKVQINAPASRRQAAQPAAAPEPEQRSPCEQAQFVLKTYESASSLAEKTEDGETRVLGPEEARAKIEQARADEQRLCEEQDDE